MSLSSSQYINWLVYTQEGLGLTLERDSIKPNMNHLGVDTVCPYFESFLIPMAFISSNGTGAKWDMLMVEMSHIKDSTTTYDYRVGDDAAWEKLYRREMQHAVIPLNEVMSVFNSLGVGKAWMYVLYEFCQVFEPSQTGNVKDSIRESWATFMEYHNVRLTWTGYASNGIPATEVPLIYMKGYDQPEGVVAGIRYVFPKNTTVMPGGHFIADIIRLNFYEYDENSTWYIKDYARQYPLVRKKLSREKVFAIENGEVVTKSASIVDTGVEGVPPIEVLKLYNALPATIKDNISNPIEAINHYLSSGAIALKSVHDWLRSNEVQAILLKNRGVEIPQAIQETITSIPNVPIVPVVNNANDSANVAEENSQLAHRVNELEQMLAAKKSELMELNKKLYEKTHEAEEYANSVEELEKTVEGYKDVIEHLNKRNAQEKEQTVQPVVQEVKQEPNVARPTLSCLSEYKFLEDDKWFVASLVMCAEMRKYLNSGDYAKKLADFEKLYKMLEMLVPLNPKEDPIFMKSIFDRHEADMDDDCKAVLNKIRTILEI